MAVGVAGPARTPVYEIGRLSRGAALPVRQVGPGRYVVAGSRAPWFVDVTVDPPCDCPDLYYRGSAVGYCKHAIAALLQEREPMLMQALEVVLEQRGHWEDR